MERIEAIRETELEIEIWKNNQEKFRGDISFWHYAQNQIDELEVRLDKITRLENWYEYV